MRYDADGRGGTEDGVAEDGEGRCTREGVEMEEHTRRATGGGVALAIAHQVGREIGKERVGLRGDIEDGLNFFCCGGEGVCIDRLLGGGG